MKRSRTNEIISKPIKRIKMKQPSMEWLEFVVSEQVSIYTHQQIFTVEPYVLFLSNIFKELYLQNKNTNTLF